MQLVGIGGEEDDRDVASSRTLTDQGGGLEAVHPGHVDVEENEGELLAEEVAQRFPAGCGRDYVLAQLGQEGRERQ